MESESQAGRYRRSLKLASKGMKTGRLAESEVRTVCAALLALNGHRYGLHYLSRGTPPQDTTARRHFDD